MTNNRDTSSGFGRGGVVNDEILTIDDIAALYKVSRERARDTIVKQPGFPDLAPGSTWRQPRWVAAEVRSYIRRRSPQSPRTGLQPA